MRPYFEWRDAPIAKFAVLGDPISHSLSPKMFNAVLSTGKYVALRVPESEFSEALDHLTALGYVGVNATLPLKFAARDWATSCDPEGVEAINCLRLSDRAGANTDIDGIQARIPASAKRALVLGAGGTAYSAVRACLARGLSVKVWNRTRPRALELGAKFPGVEIHPELTVAGFDTVIQTTSAERFGEPLHIDWKGEPGFFLDVNYVEGATTQACRDAQAAGWQAEDGIGVLVAQAVAAYRFWTGETLDADRMERAASA